MAISLTIHGVKPAAFDEMLRLVEHGVGAQCGEGTIDFQGVSAGYSYESDKGDLSIELLEHPQLVTDGYLVGWVVDTLVTICAH